jgi:hypothetical protein
MRVLIMLQGLSLLSCLCLASGCQPAAQDPGQEAPPEKAPTLPDTAAHAVPPPVPVETVARVGVYIFPGWYRDTGTGDYPYPTHDEESEWRLIAEFANPRPVLGFYDDSLPEVNDWHIKWALEAGISWFAFDWYWNAGEKRLSRSLEKGFLEAGYNTQMDFCIHWCNHGLDWKNPLDFSEPALVEMTQYMIGHYFTRPNYMRVDGRPVLMIWDIRPVLEANGGEDAFRDATLPRLNALCHEAGLGDLFLIHVDNAPLRIADIQTGDAITGYSYAHLTTDTPFGLPGSAPYSEMVEALPGHWDRIIENAALPFIVSTQAGWDSTPRTLAHNRNPENLWARTGNTADLFEATLREGAKRISPDLPFFLIEAWNEWGEGSFIEPSASHGFGHLDALRRVFAPDAPAWEWARPTQEQIDSYSVLKGDELAAARQRESLPDPPPPVIRQAVRVSRDPEVLSGNLLAEHRFDDPSFTADLSMSGSVRFVEIRGDAAVYEVTGGDPHIVVSGDWGGPAHDRAVALRVRYTGPALLHAEFFWAADGDGTRSDRSRRVEWPADGQFHTYVFTFDEGEETGGNLTTLRFDLPDEPGATAEIEWLRVYDTAQ